MNDMLNEDAMRPSERRGSREQSPSANGPVAEAHSTPPVAGRWQVSEKVKRARFDAEDCIEKEGNVLRVRHISDVERLSLDALCEAVAAASGSAGAAPTKEQIASVLVETNYAYVSQCEKNGWAIVGKQLADRQADAVLALFPSPPEPSQPSDTERCECGHHWTSHMGTFGAGGCKICQCAVFLSAQSDASQAGHGGTGR